MKCKSIKGLHFFVEKWKTFYFVLFVGTLYLFVLYKKHNDFHQVFNVVCFVSTELIFNNKSLQFYHAFIFMVFVCPIMYLMLFLKQYI